MNRVFIPADEHEARRRDTLFMQGSPVHDLPPGTNYPILLRGCYAMSGTDISRGSIRLRACYATSSTDLAYAAARSSGGTFGAPLQVRLCCYQEVVPAVGSLNAGSNPSIVLRICYNKSDSNAGYAAMQCPVLTHIINCLRRRLFTYPPPLQRDSAMDRSGRERVGGALWLWCYGVLLLCVWARLLLISARYAAKVDAAAMAAAERAFRTPKAREAALIRVLRICYALSGTEVAYAPTRWVPQGGEDAVFWDTLGRYTAPTARNQMLKPLLQYDLYQKCV
eukprot:3044547-Rhodomonas_salina.1